MPENWTNWIHNNVHHIPFLIGGAVNGGGKITINMSQVLQAVVIAVLTAVIMGWGYYPFWMIPMIFWITIMVSGIILNVSCGSITVH